MNNNEQRRQQAEQMIRQEIQQYRNNNHIIQIFQGYQGQIVNIKEQRKIYKLINYNHPKFIDIMIPLFQNEIQKLSQLATTQLIPPYFHQNTDHNNFYYLCEAYMNMGDLWKFTGEIMYPNQIVTISAELQRLVNQFHNLGFYHFDIKQQNFLMHKDYQFKILSNGQPLPLEQALQQLYQNLGITQQVIQIEPNYTQMQRIMNESSRQIINWRLQDDSDRQQFQYWLQLFLQQNRIDQFQPNGLFTRQLIRIVFCDFGFTQFNNIPKQSVGTPGYISPFLLLYPKLLFQDQNIINNIARQCDLFSLGMTIFQFLNSQSYLSSNQPRNIEFILIEQNIIQVNQQIRQEIIQLNNHLIKDLQINLFQLCQLLYYKEVKRVIQIQIQQIDPENPLMIIYRLLDQLITFSFFPTQNIIDLNQNGNDFDSQNFQEYLEKIWEASNLRQPQQRI